MTDTAALLAAYDENTRARIHEPRPAGVSYEWDGLLLRTVGGMNRGFVETPRDPGVRGAELDALIARQRDYFAARGEAVEWKTRGHDLPEDLTERLVAAGFEPEDRETVVIGEAAALATEPVLPEGVTLRQVVEDERMAEDLRRIAQTHGRVWGEDHSYLADDLGRRIATGGDGFAVFVAEAHTPSGPDVVCAAWLALREGEDFAGLWGGSTLAEWRGRGIYKAMVARRAQLAAQRGVKYLQVDASEDSRPILQRLGLHAVTTTTPYVWKPTR
ncbi:MAG TPA: GNAT family N-acetyltransferase [Actinocrinis sp.]|nr:GNAT family N-acetyltransferase [Actinocrinis sp.]